MAGSRPQSNFTHLKAHDEQLVRLGLLAERYFAEDPNTCLIKLRQLTELLAQLVASQIGLFTSPEEKQVDLLRRLQDQGIVPREVGALFAEVRRAGNDANHRLAGDHRTALLGLRLTWQLSVWFHRTFKEPAYKSGPFLPPVPPADEGVEIKAEFDQLRADLTQYRAAHQDAAQALDQTKAQVKQTEEERAFWESMAAEAEASKSELVKRLEALQAQARAQPTQSVAKFVAAANTAAAVIQISESDTRKLIYEQLAAAGWTVDSASLTFNKRARPQKNKHLAIAEWPTETGPADYVLFIGLTPVAVVEAKRRCVDVSGALQQAKRYSRTFKPTTETELPAINYGAEGTFRVPFAFSSNGRPYLRQLATKSGVWFCDLRRIDNLSHALDGWYTPEGLTALLKRDEAQAHQQLANEPFNYGFALRPYQQAAIRAAETSIEAGQRELLLAMATGTGKTKTCIALIYRLLKAERFRRVLFLVDRSVLGEQAANAFKDTRMENLQTFANTFGIKELEDMAPDSDTSVHIATVQGMVQRLLYAADDADPPSVDQYDCIVIDECHRGYLLDRELSDTELTFRGGFDNFSNYISKYRRVLDYFDAVKIGLTATPALHTTQIFGAPVYTYSYREAVIDGYLVDYEPPIQITTELSSGGIHWKVGEQLKIYDVQRDQIELFKAPDEIKLEVEDFILMRFRHSILASAAAGKLTEDWRAVRNINGGAVKLPQPWSEMRLAQLCDPGRVITYGVIKLGIEVPDGVPCLRTSNVRWLRVDIEGMKRIAPALSAEYGRTVLKGGEVLVNVRGTLGGVSTATSEMAGWNVSREVAVVPVDVGRVDPKYLALWIGCDATQGWLGRVKRGVAYTGINIEDLRKLPVNVPSKDEQSEIIRRIESLFAWADRLEARHAAARAYVERLTPALLAKAFRGELVPQDPADEPASELLKRLGQRPADNSTGLPKRRVAKPGRANAARATLRA